MPPSVDSSSSLISDAASHLSLRRILRRVSSRLSRKSHRQPDDDSHSTHPQLRPRKDSYVSYSVYQQNMQPMILRDPDATRKLLDTIFDTPGGRRSLSRLARTCKGFRDPALDALWRELPSFLPLVAQFPSSVLKKVKKPGLGFAKAPVGDDWNKFLAYGERVRKITYDESVNNVSSAIFSVIESSKPRTYLLSKLQQLNWRAETPTGLSRCSMFLNPGLQGLSLEIGERFPQMNDFLADMASRVHLKSLSFVSPINLPDAFTDLLLPQKTLEKVALVAPGALSSGIGKWAAGLPHLRTLQLDLTGRSLVAVEGFFDDIRTAGSGASTPSSIGSPDSGVFSGEELDFSEIKKSSLRLTGDLQPSKTSFPQLQNLHLTGEASTIAVFLRHLNSQLVNLDLVIEDPPDEMDWQELSIILSERFGHFIQSLRVTATGASRFTDLVRSTARMEPPTKHLSLTHFSGLTRLSRLEVDLPESIIFYDSDIESIAKGCPNIEILRLCPVSRFPPTTAPYLTLEGLAPLIKSCRRLNTLAVVINAKGGSEETLFDPASSSQSLLRLHVGHSWIADPLQVTIFISHFAPHLEFLKFYQEKNRPGYVESRAQDWQKVSDYLPYLQKLRLTERLAASNIPQVKFVPPAKVDKAVDATVDKREQGVIALPSTGERAVQSSPNMVSMEVQVEPQVFSVAIDATPALVDVGILALTPVTDQSVSARPLTTSTAVATITQNGMLRLDGVEDEKTGDSHMPHLFPIPSVYNIFSFACKTFITFPLSIPFRLLEISLAPLQTLRHSFYDSQSEKQDIMSSFSSSSSSEGSDIVIAPVGH